MLLPESPADARYENLLAIRVYGARTHNLQKIDVEIPLARLTVVTGVSGSGKSSLALDTIFAEGRHRYFSSISSSSRELLQAIDRPDVDFIDGLPPVLCVEQRISGARKRSTVATASDVYEYLRLFFARVGQLYCPTCHQPVAAQSRTSIVDQALRFQDRRKVIVLAPLIRSQAGLHAETFARIVKDGYVRARVDGEIVDASSPPPIAKTKPHDIDIVVDRLIIKEGIRSRLEESVDLALQLGRGQCLISHEIDGGWEDRLYSSHLACATCSTSYPAIEPRLFNFNSPIGACPKCHGFGVLVSSDNTEQVCDACGGTRLGPIPLAVQVEGTSIADFCSLSPVRAAEIVAGWLLRFSSHANDGDPAEAARGAIAKHVLPEIAARLKFLSNVGLDYLTLDRGCETLSAGELQRTRLAACLGNQLNGACYILDEPTAGLHPRDTRRLLQSLIQLRDNGNTVLLIEHDLEVIRAADHVIDLGPGAGTFGGQVVATGSPNELIQNPASVTGPFLIKDNDRSANLKQADKSLAPGSSVIQLDPPCLRLTGATLHHLKDVTIELPLKKLVCVTGVSGSGKTSLVLHTLVPALGKALKQRSSTEGSFRELSGFESLSRLVRIDQSALGRSARSSLATYSGLWSDVRSLFAKTKEARFRGMTPRSFSLSVPEARCPRCSGQGELPVDEHRFADWNIRCPECDGRRFSPMTLSIRYREKSVADVLDMSVAEAASFFENLPRLARTLTVLNDLGLEYIKLGQSARTLSGGEAQRIKLGTELAKSTGLESSTLFVLDEPTSGLHVADVQQLVGVLRRLVMQGHSVLVIEHNEELIAAADWIIEMGPDAGPNGGEIVFSGLQESRIRQ